LPIGADYLLAHFRPSGDNFKLNVPTDLFALYLMSVGILVAEVKAQQPPTATHEGFVDCSSGTNHELIPV
jgi:hypothetical protein